MKYVHLTADDVAAVLLEASTKPYQFTPADEIPKKTIIGYKLFEVKNGKLYSKYFGKDTYYPMHKWLSATVGGNPIANSVNNVKEGGKKFAKRPGWHGTDYPLAMHIYEVVDGVKYRRPYEVWAEVEFGADVDWQKEANKRARIKKDGNLDAKTAHIQDQVPKGGYYRYKTNPNMFEKWILAGEMKINKILTDEQVAKINSEIGKSDLPRRNPLDLASLGL